MTGDEILRDAVAQAAGFDVQALGEDAFLRSVDARMARCGLASREEYAAALRGSAAELQNLVEELAVPETWFFRDRGPFEFLRDWARTAPHPFVRVLSAPCSTGEEPYSIAIVLLEAGLPPDRFSIDAADISRRALEAGVRAVYRKSSFRETWAGYRDYFTPVEDGFALRKEIAGLVQFHCDNLVDPSFMREQRPYDLVFCRNLLIYLGAEARRAVLRNVDRLLAPDGVVVVGAPEVAVFVRSGYTAVSHQYSFACSRTPPAVVQPPPVSARSIRNTAAPTAPADAVPAGEASLETAWTLADEGALEQASQVCDALLAKGPAAPDLYYLKGLLSDALNRLDAAEDWYRKALYLDPDHYPALLHMSALCERRGERSRGDLFRARAKRGAGRGIELNEPRY